MEQTKIQDEAKTLMPFVPAEVSDIVEKYSKEFKSSAKKKKVTDKIKLAKKLNDKCTTEVYKYMKKYFYCVNNLVYYHDVAFDTFTQFKRSEVKDFISNEYAELLMKKDKDNGIKEDIILNVNPRKFFNHSTFYNTVYHTTIDPSRKEVTFIEKNHNGIELNYLNMVKPMRQFDHIKADRKDYEDDLQFIYDHIKFVWANNDDDLFVWIMNFLACSFAGRKVRQCLYLQVDEERTGRGSIINFCAKILKGRFYKTSSVEQIVQYTKNFEGRTLINLDELPVDGTNFKSVGDKLKGLITEPEFDCRDMHKSAYSQINTFNIIITSQNNAVNITTKNKDRFLFPEINTGKKGNTEHFTKLHGIMNKEEVQKLFYEDMINIYNTRCTTWKEDIKPFCPALQKRVIESLHPFLKWFKQSFALRKRDLKHTASELQEEFKLNSNTRMTNDISLQRISKLLQKLKLTVIPVTTGGSTKKVYKASGEEVLNAFRDEKWIDDDVDFVDKEFVNEDDDFEEKIKDNDEMAVTREDFKKHLTKYHEKHHLKELKEKDDKVKALQDELEKLKAHYNLGLEVKPEDKKNKVKKTKKDIDDEETVKKSKTVKVKKNNSVDKKKSKNKHKKCFDDEETILKFF